MWGYGISLSMLTVRYVGMIMIKNKLKIYFSDINIHAINKDISSIHHVAEGLQCEYI